MKNALIVAVAAVMDIGRKRAPVDRQPTHLELCERDALGRASYLWSMVEAGRLNASAVEGLMRSYLDQPALWPEQRKVLLGKAMQRRNEFK